MPIGAKPPEKRSLEATASVAIILQGRHLASRASDAIPKLVLSSSGATDTLSIRAIGDPRASGLETERERA